MDGLVICCKTKGRGATGEYRLKEKINMRKVKLVDTSESEGVYDSISLCVSMSVCVCLYFCVYVQCMYIEVVLLLIISIVHYRIVQVYTSICCL